MQTNKDIPSSFQDTSFLNKDFLMFSKNLRKVCFFMEEHIHVIFLKTKIHDIHIFKQNFADIERSNIL